MLGVLLFIIFQGTEELLRKEANLTDIDDSIPIEDVNGVLAAYKSDGDPDLYESSYLDLKKFVENSLDIYRVMQIFIY